MKDINYKNANAGKDSPVKVIPRGGKAKKVGAMTESAPGKPIDETAPGKPIVETHMVGRTRMADPNSKSFKTRMLTYTERSGITAGGRVTKTVFWGLAIGITASILFRHYRKKGYFKFKFLPAK